MNGKTELGSITSGYTGLKGISALVLSVIFVLASLHAEAGKKKKDESTKSDTLKSGTFSGLKWRSIGPAFTSGRIADFAVNPDDHSEYFVAAASGHVWKPRTTARHLNLSSTITEHIPWVASPSTPAITMWYGWARARTTTSVHWDTATVFINRKTAGRIGER